MENRVTAFLQHNNTVMKNYSIKFIFLYLKNTINKKKKKKQYKVDFIIGVSIRIMV